MIRPRQRPWFVDRLRERAKPQGLTLKELENIQRLNAAYARQVQDMPVNSSGFGADAFRNVAQPYIKYDPPQPVSFWRRAFAWDWP